MQRREKLLLFAVLGLLVLWRGAPIVRQTFYGPIEERRHTLAALDAEVRAAEDKQLEILRATKQMAEWRNRSLPPDAYDAQRLYLQWLTDTAQLAGLKDLKITRIIHISRVGPYIPVQVRIEGKGALDQIGKFLHYFHRIDLLHRIASLKIESPSAEGNPQFAIDMTAEGIALRDAPERDRLFPEAEIAADLSASSTELTVAEADGFPREPGFRIRIGNEYATVTKVDGEKWTLARGADATSAASHKKGALVALAPVHPEYAERTTKDYATLIADNPFVKPAPPAAAPAQQNDAAFTRLVSSVARDGVYEAWLYDRSNNKTLVLNVGSSFKVSDISARVVEITNDGMVLERDEARWALRLGDDLPQMRRLPASAATEAEADGQQNAAGEGSSPARGTAG